MAELGEKSQQDRARPIAMSSLTARGAFIIRGTIFSDWSGIGRAFRSVEAVHMQNAVLAFTEFLRSLRHSYRGVYSFSSTLSAVLIRYGRTPKWTLCTSSA